MVFFKTNVLPEIFSCSPRVPFNREKSDMGFRNNSEDKSFNSILNKFRICNKLINKHKRNKQYIYSGLKLITRTDFAAVYPEREQA